MSNEMNPEHLRLAIKDEIARYGDGSTISPSHIIASAQRRRKISKVRRAAGGLTALTVAAGGAFALASAPAAATDWKLSVAPEQVNQRIVQLVEDQLPADAKVTGLKMKAYAKAKPGQKDLDGFGIPLPRSEWSKADSWYTTVELSSGVELGVLLGHAAGETEGDPEALCAELLAGGDLDVCDAGSISRQDQSIVTMWRDGRGDRSANGDLWGAGTLITLYGDEAPASSPVSIREFEAQPGGDFFIHVQLVTPEGSAPLLDQTAMADIALNEDLLATE